MYASQKYKVEKRTKNYSVPTTYVIGGGGNPGQRKSSQLIWRSDLILQKKTGKNTSISITKENNTPVAEWQTRWV